MRLTEALDSAADDHRQRLDVAKAEQDERRRAIAEAAARNLGVLLAEVLGIDPPAYELEDAAQSIIVIDGVRITLPGTAWADGVPANENLIAPTILTPCHLCGDEMEVDVLWFTDVQGWASAWDQARTIHHPLAEDGSCTVEPSF